MLFNSSYEFTKDNLDDFLKEVAKEYRKRAGKSVKANLIIVGGASAVINYSFRETTLDVDAMINAASSIKDAINLVGDRHGLPNRWLNDDFCKTSSFSDAIFLYSKYYRTFSNIVEVRTVVDEYLVAMKLMSGRQYKHDLSDAVGVLMEKKREGAPLTIKDIKRAATELYESWEAIPERSREIIEAAFATSDLEAFFKIVRTEEEDNKSVLVEAERKRPGVVTSEKVDGIIATAREKAGKGSLIAALAIKQNQAKNKTYNVGERRSDSREV